MPLPDEEIVENATENDSSPRSLGSPVKDGESQSMKEAIKVGRNEELAGNGFGATLSAETDVDLDYEEFSEDEIEIINLDSTSSSPTKNASLSDEEMNDLFGKKGCDQNDDRKEVDSTSQLPRDDEEREVETAAENILVKNSATETVQETVKSGDRKASLNFDISNVSNSAMDSVGSEIVEWWEKRLSGDNLPNSEDVDISTNRSESSNEVEIDDEAGRSSRQSSSSNQSFQEVFVNFATTESIRDQSASEKDKVEDNVVEVSDDEEESKSEGENDDDEEDAIVEVSDEGRMSDESDSEENKKNEYEARIEASDQKNKFEEKIISPFDFEKNFLGQKNKVDESTTHADVNCNDEKSEKSSVLTPKVLTLTLDQLEPANGSTEQCSPDEKLRDEAVVTSSDGEGHQQVNYLYIAHFILQFHCVFYYGV